MFKKLFLPIFILLTIGLGIAFAYFLRVAPSSKNSRGQNEFALAAKKIIADCKKAQVKKICYEKSVFSLMERPNYYSMDEAFKVVDLMHQFDSEYVYCHDMAHYISAIETKRNMKNWANLIGKCPSGVCGNGCIHGVLQERFGTELLSDSQVKKSMNTFRTVCDLRPGWNPSGVEHAACYHGMGHMTMYLARGDATKAAALCESLLSTTTFPDAKLLCYDGVFMSIMEPLEPSDVLSFTRKQIVKDEVLPFCGTFTGEKMASCLNEGSHLFTKDLASSSGPYQYCSRIVGSEALKNRCYDIVWYRLIRDYNLNEEKIKSICLNVTPRNLQSKCFRGIAVHMIETDWRWIPKAVHLCTYVRDLNGQKECYNGVSGYVTFGFPAGSKAQETLCKNLPEPWRQQCLSRISQ